MATSSLGTFRNSVKPVGEEIVIDFNNTAAIAAGDSVEWDYELPANLVVTDLMMVKTGVNAVSDISVDVIKVSNTDPAVETVIAHVARALAPNVKGTVTRSGSTVATDLLYGSGSAGSLENRLVGVLSNVQGVPGTTNNRQTLRVRLSVATAGSDPGEAATMIKISLSRFSSVSSKFDEVVTVEG